MTMRFIVTAACVGVLVFGGLARAQSAAPAAAPPGEKSTLQKMLQQNENLTQQIDKAKKTGGVIAQAELENQGRQAAIRGMERELRRWEVGLDREERDIFRQGDQAGCPWGTKHDDAAFVAACNAEGRRLSGLFQQVQQGKVESARYRERIEQTRRELSQQTERLFQKKKANNADLEDLYAARTVWQQRFNNFVFNDSPTFRRLRDFVAPESNGCVPAEGADDEALVKAAGCLRWISENVRR